MPERPQAGEAAPYFFQYIDQVTGDDPIAILRKQLEDARNLFASIGEAQSLHRYAEGKWSIREAVNHVTDIERAFAFRALSFGRGMTAPLPSYDQETAAAHSGADSISFAAHRDEFETVRAATLTLFENMPDAAWARAGIASGKQITVRALAFLIAGHCQHHLKIIEDRYLA